MPTLQLRKVNSQVEAIELFVEVPHFYVEGNIVSQNSSEVSIVVRDRNRVSQQLSRGDTAEIILAPDNSIYMTINLE